MEAFRLLAIAKHLLQNTEKNEHNKIKFKKTTKHKKKPTNLKNIGERKL